MSVPSPQAVAVADTTSGASGFAGLNHVDQRFLAGTGPYANTQFSLEPPDQGLCVGNGKVLEPINTAVVVYDEKGNRLTPVAALNQFFNLAPEVVRPSGPFGDFTSDPKCYFDSSTNQWFLTMLQIDVVAGTGAYAQKSHIEIAVSLSGDPTGTWALYSLDTTDDGTNGTPSHPGCPCFGDQPLIGADANGFYVSTNEFTLHHPFGNFVGAQVYAMSKEGVESGESLGVVHIDTGPSNAPDCGTSCWYSIQPATSPPGGRFARNTEYFLSALDFGSTFDNRIAFWSLTGTDSLNTDSPRVALSVFVLQSEVYATPFPGATQKPGPTPLGSLVNEPLEKLATNDDRMNQVVYADGKLWSAVNTLVAGLDGTGTPRTGIAYFIVEPGRNGARIASQGYVSVEGENVIFPSIGVNRNGEGVMAFTLVGPDYYPSAAYALISAGRVGDVHIAAAGFGPEDGFTGYKDFYNPPLSTNPPARWGDYSAAVADEDGSIWMGTEFIPGPRTLLANWGTFLYNVTPQDQSEQHQ